MNPEIKRLWGSAGVALLSLVYLYEAWDLPFGELSAPDIGFLPKAAALGLLGLCLVTAGLALLALAKSPATAPAASKGDSGEAREAWGRVAKAAAVLLAYPLLLPWLGFLPVTALVLYGVLRVVEYRTRLASLLVALVTTGLSWAVFAWALRVQFPRGILG